MLIRHFAFSAYAHVTGSPATRMLILLLLFHYSCHIIRRYLFRHARGIPADSHTCHADDAAYIGWWGLPLLIHATPWWLTLADAAAAAITLAASFYLLIRCYAIADAITTLLRLVFSWGMPPAAAVRCPALPAIAACRWYAYCYAGWLSADITLPLHYWYAMILIYYATLLLMPFSLLPDTYWLAIAALLLPADGHCFLSHWAHCFSPLRWYYIDTLASPLLATITLPISLSCRHSYYADTPLYLRNIYAIPRLFSPQFHFITLRIDERH